jgi:hypothetical protein
MAVNLNLDDTMTFVYFLFSSKKEIPNIKLDSDVNEIIFHIVISAHVYVFAAQNIDSLFTKTYKIKKTPIYNIHPVGKTSKNFRWKICEKYFPICKKKNPLL